MSDEHLPQRPAESDAPHPSQQSREPQSPRVQISIQGDSHAQIFVAGGDQISYEPSGRDLRKYSHNDIEAQDESPDVQFHPVLGWLGRILMFLITGFMAFIMLIAAWKMFRIWWELAWPYLWE